MLGVKLRVGLGLVALAGSCLGLAGCSNDEQRSVEQRSSAIVVAVEGTVRDSANAAIADTLVEFRDSSSNALVDSDTTAPDGSYAVSVDDGTYDIVVTPPEGSIFLPQTFSDQLISADTTFDIVLVVGDTFAIRPPPV